MRVFFPIDSFWHIEKHIYWFFSKPHNQKYKIDCLEITQLNKIED